MSIAIRNRKRKRPKNANSLISFWYFSFLSLVNSFNNPLFRSWGAWKAHFRICSSLKNCFTPASRRSEKSMVTYSIGPSHSINFCKKNAVSSSFSLLTMAPARFFFVIRSFAMSIPFLSIFFFSGVFSFWDRFFL